MRQRTLATATAILLLAMGAATATHADDDTGKVTGERKQWHRVTVTFIGPQTSESAEKNPFRDYRLNVAFTNEKAKMQVIVPGFFAADGNAGESGAEEGDKWRVHFTPPATGKWDYVASFREGDNVALSLERTAGRAVSFDGARGAFTIAESDKTGRDFRARGALRHTGGRYLQFAGSGEHFIKGGADSPENFLAFADFDGTYRAEKLSQRKGENFADKLHKYGPHVRDFNPGDPTWRGGKGKGIIGAVNYLASEGVNSIYMLSMNVAGDGKDVWPWTAPNVRDRFDCSKLDQWELVFSHMDTRGVMMHIITQEQENDQLLDGGELGDQRKLYYRELIARFAHHPAVVWNLGEENTNTDAQRKAFCRYIKALDAYDHQIVCHTFPGKYDEVYEPLLGFEYFNGPSLQTNDTHNQTRKWIDRSQASGRPWFVSLDEIGPANTGVKPDADDPEHNEVRHKHLWGHLMAGGAGVEWYFGYKFAHNDLNLEDFRSRANMWKQTRIAREFFEQHLPFTEMRHADELTDAGDDYVFAKPGEVYAIYLPEGGSTKLNLGALETPFNVRWYNPREGGKLQFGSSKTIKGPGMVSIGDPPAQPKQDWAVLITTTEQPRRATLKVHGGVGGGEYAIGAAVPLRAVPPPGRALGNWVEANGDETLDRGADRDIVVVLGEAGATYLAHFTDAPRRPARNNDNNAGPFNGRVTGFTLINADTNQPIAGFDPIKPNATIDLSKLPTRNLSIRANVSGRVDQVAFDLNDQRNTQREGVAPYSLTGDTDGNYNAWMPKPGKHTVTAKTGGKSVSVTFNIVAK